MALSRTADYTIQGFLYQFQKTIIEILNSSEGSEITVEGMIEDIDISSLGRKKAIQCKYHEAQKKYSLSIIYKPLLQMMEHFVDNHSKNIHYVLYAYFPDQKPSQIVSLSIDELRQILQSSNRELEKYVKKVKHKIDLAKFRKRFSLQFGESFEKMTELVLKSLDDSGLPSDNIETLIYPNAIQKIANLSMLHGASKRIITKKEFVDHLKGVRRTAISGWISFLKTRKQLLDIRRKQLKKNIGINTRLRFFFIPKSTIEDFNEGIVTFIEEYLGKFHFKTVHTETPLFCLDCSIAVFNDICKRIHEKGIKFEDGIIGNDFNIEHLFREPMTKMRRRNTIEKEFYLRLARYENDKNIFNHSKCADLFIATNDSSGIDYPQDVNVEILEVTKLSELKYLLGVCDAC